MARSLRLLVDDLVFPEAPRWRDGRLWFSDLGDRAVRSVSLSGDVRTEFRIGDMPSGLGWMRDGSLLIVSMTKRRLLRQQGDAAPAVWADLSGTAAFHCNDMVVDHEGGAYVGEFGFDLPAEFEQRGFDSILIDHPTATLTYVSPAGATRVVADDMHFPNGSLILPDSRTLIVGETLAGRLTAFDIGPDGALTNRRVWAPTAPYMPDGIALDADGSIWIADPFRRACIRFKEGGELLETIATERSCLACDIGGPDGRTLFLLTAEHYNEHDPSPPRVGQIWTATL